MPGEFDTRVLIITDLIKRQCIDGCRIAFQKSRIGQQHGGITSPPPYYFVMLLCSFALREHVHSLMESRNITRMNVSMNIRIASSIVINLCGSSYSSKLSAGKKIRN